MQKARRQAFRLPGIALRPLVGMWFQVQCPPLIGVLPIFRSRYFVRYRSPERTQGTETSHYLEEEKEKSIPSVAASESGRAQTKKPRFLGL